MKNEPQGFVAFVRREWQRSRVVVLYVLFAALWIAESDSALAAFVTDRADLVHYGTYKGWLFVAITALLLQRAYTHHWREIEARQSTEQTLQKTVSDLESFSYMVSHDLRAPLSAINAFAAAVQEGEGPNLSDKGRHRLERIVAGGQRMNAMIDDILAFSRAERTELRLAAVDLHSLASEVVGELREQWPETAIAVRPLPVVRADRAMMRQVLVNLLGNALKFSSRRPDARVEVEAQVDARHAHVRVRDNGAGFDKTYAEKLFGMFQRLHHESEFPGTGVGLAIVKRIVSRHGGSVSADSVPGGWTTFSFTLPAT